MQDVVNEFAVEIGHVSLSPELSTTIATSGSAILGHVYSQFRLQQSGGGGISPGIIVGSNNSNIASIVVSVQTLLPNSLTKTKAKLESHQIPLQSVTKSLEQTLRRVAPKYLPLVSSLIADLESSTHPDLYSNASKNLRELLGLLYRKFSPDEIITGWPGVDLDEKNKRPTRYSRLRFAALSLLPLDLYPPDFIEQVDNLASRLRDSYGDLSKLTHTDGTPTDSVKARPLLHNIILDIIAWLNSIQRGRELRAMHVLELFQVRLPSLVGDLYPLLAEGYSHAYEARASAEDCTVFDETKEFIEVIGTGEVDFTIQIGSNSDVRNGDGLIGRASRSFGFQCSMRWDACNNVLLPENPISLSPPE
jgi:hypothetical protein